MVRDLTVTILVPGPLREYCGGASQLSTAAASVRSALLELERNHPTLYRNVCDETGAVRRHINIFVNAFHMRDRDGLDTALVPGDEVIILPAVSGGRECQSV
jgi:molybdopterin synthase sulfur carrier subunit